MSMVVRGSSAYEDRIIRCLSFVGGGMRRAAAACEVGKTDVGQTSEKNNNNNKGRGCVFRKNHPSITTKRRVRTTTNT